MEDTIEVLETFMEHRSVGDREMDVIGELITNLSGAIEVQRMIDEDGMKPTDAANAFVKRVMGSIDKE